MSPMQSRLIKCINERGEFAELEDGYVYYWPKLDAGALTSNNLRLIADELDNRNKAWEEQIERDLKPKESNDREESNQD